MTRSGVLLGLVLALAGAGAAQPASTLIVNATVVDGTGGPQRQVAVRISGDRMTNVGTLDENPAKYGAQGA